MSSNSFQEKEDFTKGCRHLHKSLHQEAIYIVLSFFEIESSFKAGFLASHSHSLFFFFFFGGGVDSQMVFPFCLFIKKSFCTLVPNMTTNCWGPFYFAFISPSLAYQEGGGLDHNNIIHGINLSTRDLGLIPMSLLVQIASNLPFDLPYGFLLSS